MKHTRKIASLLLALVMVFALATTAFATGTNSITVNGAKGGETYRIYKMLDLSVNEALSAYSYTVNSNWTNFFTNGGVGAAYVDIDTQGYVTWKTGKDGEADMEAFGKAAAAFASENNLTSVVTEITPTEDRTIAFTGLDSGYYLVTSTYGTLAIVGTTPYDPNETINEKNPDTTIKKNVKEDSTNTFGEENTAQIGDTVDYETTIKAQKGAKNYKLHDQLDVGLTLNQDSITVKVGNTTLRKGTDYTVAFDVACKDAQGHDAICDFEISFAQTYLDTIGAPTDIVVSYSAVVNENVKISTKPNTNDTVLDFGRSSRTEWSQTRTYSFSFDIVKTDSSMKLLNGAKFELYDADTAGHKIDLVKVSNGVYRIATDAEKSAQGFTSAVIEAGRATVKGMDANTTYWLEEIEAPAGYNRLAGRVAVAIENANLSTTMNGEIWEQDNGGVQITNKAGTELPSTGGIGTTIFYVMGSILVLGAAVLLVTKKRMAMNG